MNTKNFGARGEYLARLYLEQKGFVFIRANYRTPYGEIDLILQENDELIFVEVKTRTFQSAKAYGSGAERIDREKQYRLKRAAKQFLREEVRLTRGLVPRFDTVELYLEKKDSRKIFVRHIPCAFEA